MTTNVRLIRNHGTKTTLVFNDLLPLNVINRGSGTVSVECSQSITFYDFAAIVEGCFAKGSNFREEVSKALGFKAESELKGINCVFNGKLICTVTKYRHSRTWMLLKYHEYLKSLQAKI